LLAWRHAGKRVRAGRPALFDPALFAIASFRRAGAVHRVRRGGLGLPAGLCLRHAERGQTPLFTGLLHMPYGLGMLGMA
jgi:hypothetical protein